MVYGWEVEVVDVCVGAVVDGFGVGKLTLTIAWRGQAFSHLRHILHFSGFIYARLFSIAIASKLHSLAHLPQPIHDKSHALTAAGPRSLFMQATYRRRSFGPRGRNSMMPLGQALAQAPHAVQSCGSISGIPVSGLIFISPNEHASAQSPQPRHPNPHAVSPMAQEFMAWHECSPSYVAICFRLVQSA